MSDQPAPTADTTMPCYVCEVPVPLGSPEILPDGSIFSERVDENGHVLCDAHDKEAWDISYRTQDWKSSEDHDLWSYNCATEGLKRGLAAGRAIAKEERR